MMIPALLALGLVLGFIPALRLRHKAAVTLVAAVGWAAYVALGVDGSMASALLGFALAVANTAIGIAIGMGLVALVRRIQSGSHPRASHLPSTSEP